MGRLWRNAAGSAVTDDECCCEGEKMSRSGGLGDDEDAHEEDHDKEDPHEKPIHHLGDLLPLSCLDTRGPLLAEAVGDVLDVLHHLRKRQIQELKQALKETLEEEQ